MAIPAALSGQIGRLFLLAIPLKPPAPLHGLPICSQVQQQQLPYRQHFERVAGAMALPAAAGLLHWSLLGLVGLLDTRVARKIKSLEDAKRAMIKELKVGAGLMLLKGGHMQIVL